MTGGTVTLSRPLVARLDRPVVYACTRGARMRKRRQLTEAEHKYLAELEREEFCRKMRLKERREPKTLVLLDLPLYGSAADGVHLDLPAASRRYDN